MATLHRGKLATNPKIVEVRPLTRDDLLVLRQARPAQNVVKTFRDWHHRVARCVASGMRNEEICSACGISMTRLVTHKQDPAFQELVAQYRLKVDEGFVDAVSERYATISANGFNADLMIKETLEDALDSGERLPMKTLLAISDSSADRTGLPKQRNTVNTNFNLDFAARLEATAARSGRSNIIDAVPTRSVSGPRSLLPNPASAHTKPVPSVAGIRRRA